MLKPNACFGVVSARWAASAGADEEQRQRERGADRARHERKAGCGGGKIGGSGSK